MNLRPLPPQGSTLPSCATSRFLNYSIIIAQLGALFRSIHMLRDGTAVNNFNCLLWKHLHNGSCHVPINFFKTWHCLVATLPPLTKQYLIVLFGRMPSVASRVFIGLLCSFALYPSPACHGISDNQGFHSILPMRRTLRKARHSFPACKLFQRPRLKTFALAPLLAKPRFLLPQR